MKYVLSCAVLFLATMALAQPQGQPPYQTPPTFPEARQSRPQLPPDHGRRQGSTLFDSASISFWFTLSRSSWLFMSEPAFRWVFQVRRFTRQ